MSDPFDRDLPEEPASRLDGHSSGGTSIDLPDDGATQAIPTAAAGAAEPAIESVLTASLQGKALEFRLTSPQQNTSDVFANSDVHAFLIKDGDVTAALDQFTRETSGLWEDDIALRAPEASAGAYEALSLHVKRVRRSWQDARALLTPKKSILTHVDAQFNGLLKRLAAALPLPETERKLTLDAGQVHALVRFRQSDLSDADSGTSISTYGRLLSAIHEEPALASVLGSMYVSANSPARSGPTASGLGAQALTLVDLFCDRFHPEHALHRALVTGLGAGLAHLSPRVVQKPVVDAFLAVLEKDLPAQKADGPKIGDPKIEDQKIEDHKIEEQKIRVMVYTDWLDHIVPLESRLRQEGYQALITDSLEDCLQIHRSKHPDIVILRLSAQPSIVIKAIHYLLSNGVTLTETPTFLLVDGQNIEPLASLRAQGIEGILDLQGSLDPVMLKLKNVRARQVGSPAAQPARPVVAQPAQSAAAQPAQSASAQPVRSAGAQPARSAGAGISGNLSEMCLIDLLQTLWSGQRTARVTLRPPEPSADALLLYLNKGCITYAELGALKGDAAIHRAMSWHQGDWHVQQASEAELPPPNTSLSNETILIEGCRLLEESARRADSSRA